MCAWLFPSCQTFLIRHRSEFHRKQTHTQLNTACNISHASHTIQYQFMLRWIFMACDSIQTDAIDANSWSCALCTFERLHIWRFTLAAMFGNHWKIMICNHQQYNCSHSHQHLVLHIWLFKLAVFGSHYVTDVVQTFPCCHNQLCKLFQELFTIWYPHFASAGTQIHISQN